MKIFKDTFIRSLREVNAKIFNRFFKILASVVNNLENDNFIPFAGLDNTKMSSGIASYGDVSALAKESNIMATNDSGGTSLISLDDTVIINRVKNGSGNHIQPDYENEKLLFVNNSIQGAFIDSVGWH